MNISLNDKNLPEIYTIQKILKDLGFYPLAIDGYFGIGTHRAVYAFQKKYNLPLTGDVDDVTYEKLLTFNEFSKKGLDLSIESILKVIKKNSYQLDEKQYRVNIIGIRMDNIYDNRFTDRCVLLWKNENMDWEKREYKWTTMPSLYGKGGALNPIAYHEGRPAVGVIKEGQYPQVWQFIDSYTGWLKYPYLAQVGKFQIYRDGELNSILEAEAPSRDSQWEGFNCHRMSNNNQNTDIVGYQWANWTWSAGCQGAPEPIFREVVNLIRISNRLTGNNKFDYTLLLKEDFIED